MRNYNKEAQDHPEHKYAYSFDSIMHGFMMRTFSTFGTEGKALELGCYHGSFTKLIDRAFDDFTVVDASDECIAIAKNTVNGKVKFILSTFEDATLNEKYDAIFFIHTLEHIDDKVGILQKIKGWLSDSGKLYIATPNANAPSRQIAVKMGIITHNAAITSAEKEHGHTITYSLDTLERDARAAGLNVINKGGIFFKGLANFQLDKAIETELISTEYLEGCYQLGMVYPDLCSSIYVVCAK